MNPSKNPYGTNKTDMPKPFTDAVLGLRTGSGARVFTWGANWTPTASADPMHFQIDCSPADVATGIVGYTSPRALTGAGAPDTEENELSPADFARQLDVDRINALINAKVAGSWVIAPNDANRQGQANYWAGKLHNPNDPEWADFTGPSSGRGKSPPLSSKLPYRFGRRFPVDPSSL